MKLGLRSNGQLFALIALCSWLIVGCGNEPTTQIGAELDCTLGDNQNGFVFATITDGMVGEVASVRCKNNGPGAIDIIEIIGMFDINDFTLAFSRYSNSLGGVTQTELFPGSLERGAQGLPRITLEPEEDIAFQLTFRPAVASRLPVGSLNFRTNAATLLPNSFRDRDDRTVVRLPILGQRAVGELRITPSEVDFGRKEVGEYEALPVTVTNVGSLPVNFSSYEVFGSIDFGVYIDSLTARAARMQMAGGTGPDLRCQVPENMTNTRDPRIVPGLMIDPDEDGGQGLDPGESFTLCATFKTRLETSQRGGINITTDAEPALRTINVRGNAEGPCLLVEPNPLNFGAGLVDAPNERLLELVSCGVLPVTIEAIEMVDDGGGVFSIVEESLPRTPPFALPEAEPTLPPPSRPISINFFPTALEQYTGQLRVLSNDVEQPEALVELQGRGVTNECPVARIADEDRVLRVRPLDSIVLDGSLSTDPDGLDMKPARYRWTVVSRPSGSTSEPLERFNSVARPQDGGPADNEETPFANFWVDLTGTYEIELTVIDDLGFEAPSMTCPQDAVRIRIESVPEEALTVELVWNTPGDRNQTDYDGTDMDLHLAHPSATAWFDEDWDCHYRNPNTDWGNGSGQSASLDVDDTDGAGPEKISIASPENTENYMGRPYRAAVHYFSDGSFGGAFGAEGFGTSIATVKITLSGGVVPVQEFSRQMSNWQLWEVAAIVWTPNDRRASELNGRLEDFPPPGF